MYRLILAEYKKLWKSKLTIVLLAILFLFTGIMTYYTYHEPMYSYGIIDEHWELRDLKGTIIEPGLDYNRFADRIQHTFQGPINQELIDRYDSFYQRICDQTPRDRLDDNYMKHMYDDYENRLDDVMREDAVDSIELYYENDHMRILYQLVLYGHAVLGTTASTDDKSPLKVPISLPNRSDDEQQLAYDRSIDDVKVLNALRNKQSKQSQTVYDSVIGNNLFLKAISFINIISLLVIGIILTNNFTMEKQSHTEHLQLCCVKGYKATALAKIITSLSFAAGVICIQYLIIYLLSQFYVPMRNLDILFQTQSNVSAPNFLENIFTYRELIFNSFAMHIITAISIASITLSICYLTKNRFISATLIILIIMGTYVLSMTGFLYDSQLRYMLPASMMNMILFFGDYSDLKLMYPMIGDQMIALKDIAMIIWLGISIMLCSIVYYFSKQHRIRC